MTNTDEEWIAKADELINQGDISSRYINEYPFGDLNLEDNQAVEEAQPEYVQWRMSRDNLMREVINGFYRQAGKAIAIHKYKRHGALLGVMDEVYDKLGADWYALVERKRNRAPMFNVPNNINALNTLAIPRNAENAIMGEPININRPILNFNDERNFNRYYQNEATIRGLKNSKKNPFTRKNIVKATWDKPLPKNQSGGVKNRTKKRTQ